MIGRNDQCYCGSGKKWKKCHFPNTPAPIESSLKEKYLKQYNIYLKNEQEIEGIRRACNLATEILDALCSFAEAGATTFEIDQLAVKLHKDAGAIAAPLHYGNPPYPFSICTSLNDVICHGFPDHTPLKEGDILNIDVSPLLNGYYGDSSRMVMVGRVSDEAKKVVEVSYECLMRSIKILKPGILVSEIGNTIQEYANSRGCSVVYQFVGHGVGVRFHEAPQIPHHANDVKIPLAPGMTFTIEPMINIGKPDAKIDETQWIARTIDGSLSAQWEHTVLITEAGHEILTLPKN